MYLFVVFLPILPPPQRPGENVCFPGAELLAVMWVSLIEL